MRLRARLAVYINGHGFGHATRCIAVLEEMWARFPDLPVVIRTDAPPFLFHRQCGGPYRLEAGPVDPGAIQAGPLDLDREGSLRSRAAFQHDMPERVDEEVRRLGDDDLSLVLGDIPPLAFEVAARLRIPSVALGNFSWDWIYEPYLEGRPDLAWILDGMRAAYSRADLALQLPLGGGMEAFRRRVAIPHVVRAARVPRAEMRRRLGLQEEIRPVVAVSFGGFSTPTGGGPEEADPGPYRFLAFGRDLPGLPEDTIRLPMDHPHFHPDLVAACDALITKLGYGTVAECLAHQTPFLYTDRDHFREYGALVQGVRHGARARFVPREDLLRGRLRPHLEPLLADRRAWRRVPLDGAAIAASHLASMLAS